MNTSGPTISVCVMTHNEERHIEEFLQSLSGFADEVIITDVESSDRTVEIIESFIKAGNPHVSLYKRAEDNHYGVAKNFALSKATKDYILILDPDERLSSDFKRELRPFLRDKKPEVVRIDRVDDLLMSLHEPVERIVRRENGVRFGTDWDSMVHEHFVHSFPVADFPYPLWHCQREKHWLLRPYSRFTYLRLEIERTPKTKSFFGHFMRGLWMFQYKFRRVYYRQGLRKDGTMGLRYAFLRALYAFLIQLFVGLKQEGLEYWKTPEYKERIK